MNGSRVLTHQRDEVFYRRQRLYVTSFVRAARLQALQIVSTPTMLQRGHRLSVTASTPVALDRGLQDLRRQGFRFEPEPPRVDPYQSIASDTGAQRSLVLLHFEEQFPWGLVRGAVLKLMFLAVLWMLLHMIHPQLYYAHP